MPPVPYENNNRGATMSGGNTILFDASKSEQFTISNGFRSMHRKLKNAWRIETNTAEISEESFGDVRVLVIPGPRTKFSQLEFDAIRSYISNGGSVFVMLGEGGEMKNDTNINFLLEEFGVMVNNDAVIRTAFYKYYHPKEALIANGILNRAVAAAAGKVNNYALDDDENNSQALSFLFPYGATLTCNRLSIPILSTGSVCFPLNRPVCSLHQHRQSGGKLCVLGSVHMFQDQFLDKEENAKILEVIMQFLTEELRLNPIDADDPDLADNHPCPDHVKMSDQIKVCLQEGEGEIPTRDFSKLFDGSLYSMDLSKLPICVRAFEGLGVKHEPLTLINPQFETPQPQFSPAVFAPNFRELPPPELELFDLDELFSSEKVRLAQITNKCNESDLEYFTRESAEILGVHSRLPAEKRDAKHILEFIFHQVVEFKKLNQEPDYENEGLYEPGDEEFLDDDDLDI